MIYREGEGSTASLFRDYPGVRLPGELLLDRLHRSNDERGGVNEGIDASLRSGSVRSSTVELKLAPQGTTVAKTDVLRRRGLSGREAKTLG